MQQERESRHEQSCHHGAGWTLVCRSHHCRILGLVLSPQPAPIAESVVPPLAPPTVVEKTIANAEDQTRQPVVVRDVPPFIPLTATDVALEKLRSAPAGSLKRGDQSNHPTLSGRTA